VLYLLKRSCPRRHLSGAGITVIEHDPGRAALSGHPVGQRYEAVFGSGLDWHPEGLDAWLGTAPSSPVRPAA
jgi:hypothetical protein